MMSKVIRRLRRNRRCGMHHKELVQSYLWKLAQANDLRYSKGE